MVAFLSRVLLSGLAIAVITAALVKPRRTPRHRAQVAEVVGDTLIVADGSRLPLACWTPTAPPRALVLGLHGYGDYRRAFRLAGPWLAARNIAFYAYDQRGFGETETRGEWPGAHELIHDVADAIGALRQQHPDLPLVLMGESMGGAVALAALASGAITRVEGLILAAPGVRGDVPLRQMHDVALRLAALALPWLAVELRRGAQPWLEPSEAARLADDPLVLRELSVGTYEGLIELASMASAELPETWPPTLLQYGELDGTIPRVAIDHLIQRLDDRASVRLYPDHHHLLLHEVAAKTVFVDCLDWLETSVGDAAQP